MSAYTDLKHKLANGWNTWNTRSMLSHVLLPEGFALNLGVKEYTNGGYLKEALIGLAGGQMVPGSRTYDGGYTELSLTWKSIELLVQSAVVDGEQLLLVTPRSTHLKAPLLVVEAGLLWNRPGYVRRDGDTLVAVLPEREVRVYPAGQLEEDPYIATQGPYLGLVLTAPVGISTGTPRILAEIQAAVAAAKAAQETYVQRFGDLAEVYAAAQICLAWDTIYDPIKDRVMSPVSRNWSVGSGGYAIFEWDEYFAALMAAMDNKELAYANAVEMTHEITESGFVPNYVTAYGLVSRDRSEPPVGALAVREIYRKYGEAWFLAEVYDDLLRWNRWWHEHRRNGDCLSWGSSPYAPEYGNYWEMNGVNERFGASLESGLDNSPMYDEIPFNKTTHMLEMVDVGLTSLYIRDCRALAEIAEVLGKAEAVELHARAEQYTAALQQLWVEETGLFLNKRTDTGEFSPRIAPTHFYPLLAQAATPAQVERMIAEHFYNPAEFWGEWILPSISRNDPAYPDNDYWRGRIWAPMNFLVYMGLREYDLPQARQDLAEKSRNLLLKEWREHGHVHENYNADTGEGCDVKNSDRFYHWGGLLGLIAFMEGGYW